MNRYLVVTLIAVVAIFLSRAQKFKIFDPDVVTEERLAKISESNPDRKVLLYFWQPNSAPCEKVTPMLEEIAKDYAKKVILLKIDTSNADNRAVHDMYIISAVPTLIVTKKGKEVGFPWTGPFKDKNQLITFIKPSGSY